MLQDTGIDLVDQVVSNPDPWFPSVNVKDWQELYRVPGTAPKVLVRQLRLAMEDCNLRLEAFKAAQGPTVAELPATYRIEYEEAVFATARALIIPILPSVIPDPDDRAALRELGLNMGPFFDRANMRLGRITGETLGRGRIKHAVI